LPVVVAVEVVMVVAVVQEVLELDHVLLFLVELLFVQQLVVQVQLLQEVMHQELRVALVEIVFYLVEELQQLLLMVVAVVEHGIQIDVELMEDQPVELV
tara:strand:+ start:170 stop:466 length:297 start_codon:yes stop_codon:yes gene_type:complete